MGSPSQVSFAITDAIMPSICPSKASHLGRVVGINLGTHIGRDLACAGIHGEVHLAPFATRLLVLFGIPLVFAEQLQSHAVQHTQLPSCEGLSAPAQCAVVRHGQRQPEQARHAAAERFGLAYSQVEPEPHDQHELNSQFGVAWLPVGTASLRCGSAIQRRLVQPQCDVAAAPQACLVRWPVRDAGTAPRNAIAAGGVVFERHARNVAAPSPSSHNDPSMKQDPVQDYKVLRST